MRALQGATTQQHALGYVFPPAAEEQALRDLKALLAQRISQAQAGNVVDRSLSDIAEDMRASRPDPGRAP